MPQFISRKIYYSNNTRTDCVTQQYSLPARLISRAVQTPLHAVIVYAGKIRIDYHCIIPYAIIVNREVVVSYRLSILRLSRILYTG